MNKAKRQQRIVQRVAGALIVALVALGVVGAVAGQKAAERKSYAEALAGPPCQAVAATPGFVQPTELKSVAVGPATFRFLRGDADCTVLKPGLMRDDAERPVCRFDHPGFVSVDGHPGGFVVPVGQAGVALEPRGPRCAVLPSL